MNHIPALDKSTETELLAFKRMFLKDAETLAVMPNGSDDSRSMSDKRYELKKLAHELLDKAKKENRTMSENERNAFTVCTNLLDDVQVAFGAKLDREAATRSINEVGHGMSGHSNCLETWQDVKTGRSVPVLTREHRFTDHVQRNGNEFRASEYWAALAGHNVSPEVRAAMAAGNDVKGGFLTLPEFLSADVIDLMRAKNVLVQAGARTIPLPAATCRVCRIDSDPKASWVNENQLIPDTDMTIGALDFLAHKLTCLVKISRELLADAGNAGTVIMNGIASAMAAELDSAALFGDGAGKPLGVFNNADIASYSLGTNGASLTGYDDLLYGTREIVNLNGPVPATAIMAPRTLVGYSLLKDGNGLPLVKPELIKNMQFFDSTKIAVNQTQGTSSDCSSILIGGFSEVVIGVCANIEIQILQEKYADYGQVGYLATMRVDTALYHPKAICKITGVRP